MSTRASCGVRDYAVLLDQHFERLGHGVRRIWIHRKRSGWLAGFTCDALLLARTQKTMRKVAPVAAVFHYSPFAFGAHGLPFLAPLLPLVSRLQRVPLTVVLHELCFPWGTAGWRGLVWAVWQRLALTPIIFASEALIVSTEERAEWLARTFPGSKRKLTTIPIGTNIPYAGRRDSTGLQDLQGRRVIGTLGWEKETAAVDVVLESVRLLREKGLDVVFLLIGEPGEHSAAGVRWKRSAEAQEIPSSLLFTNGGLHPADVSSYLTALEIYVHVDASGPTPRRSSLAAALAHARPTVGLAGTQTWSALRDGEEVFLSPIDARSLADGLREILISRELATKLSIGALAAYKREMDPHKNFSLIHSITMARN